MKKIFLIALMVIGQIVSHYDELLGTIIGLLALTIIVGGVVVFLAKVMYEGGYY